MQNGQLMSHVDTEIVTRAELQALPVPISTQTFKPIPHIELVDIWHSPKPAPTPTSRIRSSRNGSPATKGRAQSGTSAPGRRTRRRRRGIRTGDMNYWPRNSIFSPFLRLDPAEENFIFSFTFLEISPISGMADLPYASRVRFSHRAKRLFRHRRHGTQLHSARSPPERLSPPLRNAVELVR
jgi:hypothetical protein